MYVIFPADEVVYLSYDRVLLLPAANSAPNQASPSTASQSTGSYTSFPSTSNSSTRSKQSVASAPVVYNGCAEKNPVVKSKSFRVANESTPEQPPVRPRRVKKEQKHQQQQKSSLEKPQSFLQLPSSRSKSKTPERRLSFSDYLSQNRERTPNYSKSKSPSPSGPSPGEGYFCTNKRVCVCAVWKAIFDTNREWTASTVGLLLLQLPLVLWCGLEHARWLTFSKKTHFVLDYN